MDVAIEHRDRSEAPQLLQQLIRIPRAPAPGLIDAPQRHVREDHDGGTGRAGLEIRRDPCQLLGAQGGERPGLEAQYIDQRDKVHAGVIKAVIALVRRGLAEACKVLADRRIRDVVFARRGMQLGCPQPRKQLLRQIKFVRLRQVGDVAGVNDQRRLLRPWPFTRSMAESASPLTSGLASLAKPMWVSLICTNSGLPRRAAPSVVSRLPAPDRWA